MSVNPIQYHKHAETMLLWPQLPGLCLGLKLLGDSSLLPNGLQASVLLAVPPWQLPATGSGAVPPSSERAACPQCLCCWLGPEPYLRAQAWQLRTMDESG